MPGAAGGSKVAGYGVCLVTEIFHPEDQGGQGQQAFALAKRLRASDVDITVITRRNFDITPHGEATEEGVRIVRLEPPGLFKGRGWRAVWPTFYTGKRLAWHGVYHDEQWRHEKMRFEAMHGRWFSPTPFWELLDRELRVEAWNQVATDLWGLRREEVVGEHLLNVDIGLPLEQLAKPLRAVLGNGEPTELRVPAVNRRGRTVECLVRLAALPEDDDGHRGVIVLMDAHDARE